MKEIIYKITNISPEFISEKERDKELERLTAYLVKCLLENKE